MTDIVDLVLTYEFLKKLVMPFDKWDSYKEKIIDSSGKILNKTKFDNLSKIDIVVRNIKVILNKSAKGMTKNSIYAAALLLIKEDFDKLQDESYLKTRLEYYIKSMNEDVPTNSVSSGTVVSLGVGKDGEPPMKKKPKIMKRLMSC